MGEEEETKTCIRCKLTKSVDNFQEHSHKVRRNVCLSCFSFYNLRRNCLRRSRSAVRRDVLPTYNRYQGWALGVVSADKSHDVVIDAQQPPFKSRKTRKVVLPTNVSRRDGEGLLLGGATREDSLVIDTLDNSHRDVRDCIKQDIDQDCLHVGVLESQGLSKEDAVHFELQEDASRL